jgi:hypothetical protein
MEITPELLVLRATLPMPSVLRPGAVVVASLLDRGLLSLAGARVAATLPDDVRPGDVLRLRVQEASPERVVLQMVPSPPPVSTAAVALPGGATVRVISDEEQSRASARERSVVLRYDSPTLGRLDIRLSFSGAPVAVLARRSALDARA